ncbi:hypothetical protein [Chromohalobacter sp. 296-RDG]|uniref:hypothetical protein n=1 Tax=Chromohalobacter sp. 296-RDG TaxID=2994062 RepID=UPI002468DC1B|nr:hypothetical protein [Chromohalobacter sp. 296-RDG]
METQEVFGISPDVREASYVDRGDLDSKLSRELRRSNHVAIRGPSKSGKSWLRQKVIGDPIVVQCRLNKSFLDIYVDALSQLGINLVLNESRSRSLKGSLSASADGGSSLLARVGLQFKTEGKREEISEKQPIGHDIDDLKYIADLIKESGRRLIIEDFHYLSTEERTRFAYDLKTLWDYGCFVIIIGVWTETNLLLHLNNDLTGRVSELSIAWSSEELKKIINKGSEILNIRFESKTQEKLVEIAYSNAGVLQKLTLLTLDEAGIEESAMEVQSVAREETVEAAAMEYCEQLNPAYQQFLRRISKGIRERKNSTGIYAYAMATIIEASDEELLTGLDAKAIHARAHARQPRIQLGNLKAILEKIPELQVDEDGRGLILTYNDGTEQVSVVDRQLLLYRRFATVKWPWEDLIAEADNQGGALEAD